MSSGLRYAIARDGTYLVFNRSGDGDCSQSQMSEFRRWCRREGFVPHRGINSARNRHESAKRWIWLDGTGRWEGVSVQLCNRVTHPKTYIRRYRDGSERIIENPYRGHGLNDDSILIDCHIACFYNSQNLNGNYGLYWQDLMRSHGTADLMRGRLRQSWHPLRPRLPA